MSGYDERNQAFVRNRAVRPGSEQHGFFSDTRPEFKPFDDCHRGRGGTIGAPGRIVRRMDVVFDGRALGEKALSDWAVHTYGAPRPGWEV